MKTHKLPEGPPTSARRSRTVKKRTQVIAKLSGKWQVELWIYERGKRDESGPLMVGGNTEIEALQEGITWLKDQARLRGEEAKAAVKK